MSRGAREAALCYSRSDAGHRASYVATLGRELGLRRAGLWEAAASPKPVLFLMIEERPLAYVLIGLARAALGRRTVGLLFQAGSTLRRDTARRRAKHWLLRRLRPLGACRTLAIEPFAPGDPEAAICDGWIHDPQLWDLTAEEMAARDGALAEAVEAARAGRRVVAALGGQTRIKGFDRFARLWVERAEIRDRFLFAYGGRVEHGLASDAAAFAEAGGVGADGWVSDEDLLGLYAVADAVWCCYAPGYDQASGVFGRAVQMGVPALVRRGARIHRFCEAEGVPHMALDEDGFPAPEDLPARIPPPVEATARRRRHSLAVLEEALRPPGRPS